MTNLCDLTPIPTPIIQSLQNQGVTSVDALIEIVRESEARDKIALLTGIQPNSLIQLAKTCELLKLSKVGPQIFSILLSLGIDSLEVLATADAAQLRAKWLRLAGKNGPGGRPASIRSISRWIEQAQARSSLITVGGTSESLAAINPEMSDGYAGAGTLVN